MKLIGFQYKISSSGAWSTALELRCLEVTLFIAPNVIREVRVSNGDIRQTIEPRVKVNILIGWADIDGKSATTQANARALLHFVNAPLKRIYNVDTTTWPLLDQITTLGALFNSSSNTNYVNVVSFEYDKLKMDDTGATGQALKNVFLELETVSKYTLTLT
jgi:hypothetical protein